MKTTTTIISTTRLLGMSGLSLLFICTPLAFAQTSNDNILCLGPGRALNVNGRVACMTGDNMSTIRASLASDGFSFTATETFDRDFCGFDILFIGVLAPGEALGTNEQSAVRRFVEDGGALVYMGDSNEFALPNTSVAGIFGVTFDQEPTATSANIVIAPNHPIIDGSAGRVQTMAAPSNAPGGFGGIIDLGQYGASLLQTPSRTAVAVIESGVLQSRSGPVIFLSESSAFLDSDDVNLPDNRALIRNVFAYARTHSAYPSPCVITSQLSSQVVCEGATVTLTLGVSGSSTCNCPSGWDSVPIPGGMVCTLTLIAGQSGTYDVEVSDGCGGAIISDAWTLLVWSSASADINGDGLLNGADIAAFMQVLANPSPHADLSSCAADFDRDGDVDAADVPLFIAILLS